MTNRDKRFDCIKGIAVLLVITGHVMQACITDYSNEIIFKIIWSLQIPLFVVISGYFGIMKKTDSFCKRLIKKTITYLIPFFSYFIINTCLNFKVGLLVNFVKLFSHLEISLWYLFVLFILSEINDIAYVLLKRIDRYSILYHSVLYYIIIAIYGIICFMFGNTFLGAKYVLYYSLFYWIGWVWRVIKLKEINVNNNKLDIAYCLSFFIYSFLLIKYDFYNTPDDVIIILLRAICSMTGVIVIVRFIMLEFHENSIFLLLSDFGKKSLKFYYIHCLFVTQITGMKESLLSLEGISIIFIIIVALLVICDLFIKIISKSNLLSLIIFGERKVLELRR